MENQSSTAGVLWAGRLAEKPSPEAFAFQASVKIDRRLVFDDIRASSVHAAMLGKQGVIPAEASAKIVSALADIEADLKNGRLAIDETAEDVHSFLEGELTRRLGDTGRMVHAGRSRNDQVAVAFRLYLKRAVPSLMEEITQTCAVILDRAEEHADSLVAGYTHLQRAQPVTLGFIFCAWASALLRDQGRFADALSRLDQCPLGAGALAGSTFPLDRAYTARELGFAGGPTLNAMDSVADRDFACELAGASAILAAHLSRFCEDICLWASCEFGFVNLAEAWSTGSSIMPQKKNPDFAELIRGKTGRVVGNLTTLLTLLKGLPYAYDKDLQEDKEALFDSLDTAGLCLRMFAGMLGTARFDRERMAASCHGGFLEATDVAEYLVKKGTPFRRAHEIAASIVRACIEKRKKAVNELTLDELRAFSPLFDTDVFEKLNPSACVAARNLKGGTAPEEVRRQIAALRKLSGEFQAN
jgi:argininosuccinate lyase